MINPVRETIQPVVENSTYVDLNPKAAVAYAKQCRDESFERPRWDEPVFISTEEGYSEAEVIDFLMLGNALNFCFNDLNTGEKWGVEYEPWRDMVGANPHGSFALWAALKRAVEEGNSHPTVDLLDAETLRTLSLSDVETVFESCTDAELPLLEIRHEYLTEVGAVLQDQFDGSFVSIVVESDGQLYDSGRGFIELLQEFDAYRDQWRYGPEEETVRFDKRAQLAATMLLGKFQDREQVVSFTDEDQMTVFADYGLPIVLRDAGILEYHPELAEKVDSGEVIPAESRMELELRAATIVAGDVLLREVNERRGAPIQVPELDFYLWKQRREIDANAHLTETTAY